MSKKRWSIGFVIIFVSLLVLIGGIVWLVDPFFHYHKPLEGMAYSFDKEAYVNDGISKNFEYNAMITGTSLTRGLKVEEANELFDKQFVRVTFQGEGFKRINDNLVMAIENNPDLELVIRGIDTLWFVTDEDWYGYNEYPEYLYDDSVWNDVHYLYNKDILEQDVFPQIVRTIRGVEEDNFDNYGRGETRADSEEALVAYERPEKQYAVLEEMETKSYFEVMERNLKKNVISTIESNPDITFYLFFPPYSICWWDSMNQNGPGRVQRRIDMEEYAIEELLKYDNVRLFSFFTNYDIVCDMRNYTDEVHYTDNVGSDILKWMSEGKYELTTESYRDYIDNITEFYCNYDYDSIFVN